jgi:hypothetical protein
VLVHEVQTRCFRRGFKFLRALKSYSVSDD